MINIQITKAIKSKEDYYAMWNELSKMNPKYGLMLDIGCELGMRVSDILRLRVKDIKYPSFKFREKKTNHDRIFCIGVNLGLALKTHIRRYKLVKLDYLIFSPYKGKRVPLSRQQAYNVMKRASRTLELNNIGTHSMRKTFAYNKFQECGSVLQVQSEFNHKYISTTMVHYLSDFFEIR